MSKTADSMAARRGRLEVNMDRTLSDHEVSEHIRQSLDAPYRDPAPGDGDTDRPRCSLESCLSQ